MNISELKPAGKIAVSLGLIIGVVCSVIILLSFCYSGALGDIDSPLVNHDVSYSWVVLYPSLVVVSFSLFTLMVLVDKFIFGITHKTKKSTWEMIPYWTLGMIWVAAIGFTMSFFYFRLIGFALTLIAMGICGLLASKKPSNDLLIEEILIPVFGLILYIVFRIFKIPFIILTGVAFSALLYYIAVRIIVRNQEFNIRQSIVSMSIIGIWSLLTWYGTTLATFPAFHEQSTKTYLYEKTHQKYTVNITKSIPDSLLTHSEKKKGWQFQNFDSLAVARIYFSRCRDSITLQVPTEKHMALSGIKKLHERYWVDWHKNHKTTGDTYVDYAFTKQNNSFHRTNPHK